MSSEVILKVENLSKQYRLGLVGRGTIRDDLKRWWYKIKGKEDPFLKVGIENDRSVQGNSDYVWALKDINFEVKKGEVLGIVGANGAGKSTLLKILSKITSPTTGSAKYKGRMASLLEVGTGFHGELTGRENIYLNGAILGMTKDEITDKIDEIIDFSGCDGYIDTPVKRYSSGMTVRLAFAVAAFLEPDILIVDEVLAVGDAEFQKKAIKKMQEISSGETNRTVLFVSHNMAAVRSLCTRGILLSNGKTIYEGEINSVISEYLKVKNISNQVTFINGPLKEVKVIQDKRDVIIQAKYDSDIELDIPNLGFVMYNDFGDPILGGNPNIYKMNQELVNSYIKGEISVRIINPRLIDAQYSISIFFGNSEENHFEALDCLVFEVNGMTDIKYVNTSFIGSVAPQLQWKI